MTIIETIITTRANTSINWPQPAVHEDPNSPWNSITATVTHNNSQDGLTKTLTRTWDSRDEFITVHAYMPPDGNAAIYFDYITVPGITHTRIIETI